MENNDVLAEEFNEIDAWFVAKEIIERAERKFPNSTSTIYYGRSDEMWDRQGLNKDVQLPGYRAIADIIKKNIIHGASVLDVGCGRGRC